MTPALLHGRAVAGVQHSSLLPASSQPDPVFLPKANEGAFRLSSHVHTRPAPLCSQAPSGHCLLFFMEPLARGEAAVLEFLHVVQNNKYYLWLCPLYLAKIRPRCLLTAQHNLSATQFWKVTQVRSQHKMDGSSQSRPSTALSVQMQAQQGAICTGREKASQKGLRQQKSSSNHELYPSSSEQDSC